MVERKLFDFLLSAQDSKAFVDELTSLTVCVRKKEVVVDKDQLHHVNLDVDQLRKLPALLEDGVVVTHGNSAVSKFALLVE